MIRGDIATAARGAVIAASSRCRCVVADGDSKPQTLLSGFGVVENRVFSTCYQKWHQLPYLPMLTPRQPCCWNFN